MPIHWESRSEPIPGYRLIERLGRGGFGEVWKAQAPGGLFKAIKFVYGSVTSTGGSGEHAQQELRALSRIRRIRHPFVLSVERFDIIDGQLMIVMELADRSLEDRLRESQQQGLAGIPRPELLAYMAETADALDVMNAKYDLQHLDIKPRNIFLVGEHVKIGDFGLVKDLEGVSAEVTGGITPVYAAPETFDGWVSRFSDQYALAIVYQELLTGQRPFTGQSARQLMMQHLTMSPDVAPLPVADQPVVIKALEKDPKDRYPTCRAFVAELVNAGAGAMATLAPSIVEAAQLDDGAFEQQADVATTRLSRLAEVDPLAVDDTRRLAGVLRGVPIEPQPEGLLAPTLVIGIGTAGIECLRALRRVLAEQFGGAERWPLVRMMALDVDPAAFADVDDADVACIPVEDRLLCRLKRPAYYLREWKNLGHINEWLGPNYVFQIPAAGGTNGHRPLGRLAFFENHAAITHALRTHLESLLAPANVRAAVGGTGRPLRCKTPHVIVIAALAGGAAGMFFDVCYLARRMLCELEQSTSDVCGILLAGGGDAPHERRSPINRLAFVDELAALADENASFHARYEPTSERDQFRGPPVASVYTFGAQDSSSGDVAATVADFVCQSAVGVVGKGLDGAAADWPIYRTIGSFSIVYPRELLLRQTAQRCCAELAARWSSALPAKEAVAVQKAAESLLAATGFDPASVADRLIQDWNSRLIEPVHVAVAQRIARMQEQLDTTSREQQAALCRALVADLKGFLGSDGTEDGKAGKEEPLLIRASRPSAETTATMLAPALVAALHQTLDAPGRRLDNFHRTWIGLSQYLFQTAHQQQEAARAEQQLGARHSRGLRDLIEQLGEPHARRADPATLLSVCERWAQNKIEQHLRLQVAQVYFSLRGKLLEEYGLLPDLRRRLEELVKLTALQPLPPGPRRETLFPGGVRSLADATDQLFASVGPELLDELDARIAEKTFKSYGGLAAIASQEESVLRELAATMVAEIMSGLEPLAPPSDVAEIFCSRHPSNPDARLAEFRAYFDWASPPVALNPTVTEPTRELCFVAAPPGPSGQQFLALAQDVLADGQSVLLEDEQCSLWRVWLHRSPEAFLPATSDEIRYAYAAACRSNLSPRVFRPNTSHPASVTEPAAPQP